MRHLLLGLILLSALTAAAAECIGGARRTVDKVLIEFDCDDVERGRVFIFRPAGTYKDKFDGSEGVVFNLRPWPPFDPPAIPMAYAGGGDCVVGERMQYEGNCVARYVLPCASRRYALKVNTGSTGSSGSNKTWVRIDRSIRRPGRPTRCDVPAKRMGTGEHLSDVDLVTVTVFLENPTARLFQVVLNVSDLEDAPLLSQTYDRRKQRQIANQRGQGHGAISENARWLLNTKGPNIPETIELRLEKETP